jgi:hypothetical protein
MGVQFADTLLVARRSRAVESIHGGVNSLGHPHGYGLRGEDQCIIDDGPLGASEPAQDKVGGVSLLSISDADAKPGKLLRPELVGNVSQAFLTTVRPARPQPQFAQRQAEIVASHQHVGQRELQKPDSLSDRSAAQVHEGFRLEQQHSPIVDLDLRGQALELSCECRARPSSCQAVDQLEPDVVPGALVFGSRVAQTYDKFYRRQGGGPRHATSRPASIVPALALLYVPPGDHDEETNQLSFSFSLRSGLMTSGCAAAASASAVSGLTSSTTARTTTCARRRSGS